MKKILITAFGPFDEWEQNSSLLCLEGVRAALRQSSSVEGGQVETRIYPVDFGRIRDVVEADLETQRPQVVLYLGQATYVPLLRLERIGVNVGSAPSQPEVFHQLSDDGDLAYATDLPLDDWAASLCAAEIPARVSHHAGTYLCNATLYWSLYLKKTRGFAARPTFVHIPLTPEQARGTEYPENCLATSEAVRAVCLLVERCGTIV